MTSLKDIRFIANLNLIAHQLSLTWNRSKPVPVTMKRHVTMELGVIGPTVMENVSRSEQGKGFYILTISARFQNLIKMKCMLWKSFPRNQDGSSQESEERECPRLCFHDVSNDIDLELTTCSINKSRSKRNIQEHQMERLIGGTTAFTGSFPYIARLAFQTFDQFHSDSQV